MAKKSDDIEYNKRIDKILTLIIGGLSNNEIKDFAREQTDWGISDRQVQNYIEKAENYIIKESKINRDGEIGKAIRRLNNLYKKAERIADYKVCLNVQKELNTLLNLYLQNNDELESLQDVLTEIKKLQNEC